MGTAAAQILIDRVRGDHGPAKHIVLETALKIRDSVGIPATEGRTESARGTRTPRAAKARPRRRAATV
jgi:LacI family transcriptional regulator